jgi:hypothetical protein
MLNLYYPEIENIYRFRMSTQILHWTNLLLIMSEMMTRVHLANMINVYNPEINIIYRCNRFYIGPLNHCFLSEIMTRVYIDVTKIHLQLTNVSMLWRSTALQKDKAKEFKDPVIYSPMLTQTDKNISVNKNCTICISPIIERGSTISNSQLLRLTQHYTESSIE